MKATAYTPAIYSPSKTWKISYYQKVRVCFDLPSHDLRDETTLFAPDHGLQRPRGFFCPLVPRRGKSLRRRADKLYDLRAQK